LNISLAHIINNEITGFLFLRFCISDLNLFIILLALDYLERLELNTILFAVVVTFIVVFSIAAIIATIFGPSSEQLVHYVANHQTMRNLGHEHTV